MRINDFHGLLFEPIAESIVDGFDDFGAGEDEVLVAFGGFVDENKIGFFVNAEAVEELTGKTAFADEPAGVDFIAVFAEVDWEASFVGVLGFCCREVDVFEEGAGTGLFERVGEFFGADDRDGGANILRSGTGKVVLGKIIFERAIEGGRHLALFKF